MFFNRYFLEHGRVERITQLLEKNKATTISTHTWLRCFLEIKNGPTPWPSDFPTINNKSLVDHLIRQDVVIFALTI